MSFFGAGDQTLYRRVAMIWGLALIVGAAALLWTLPWHHQPPWSLIGLIAFAALNELVWIFRMRRLAR